MLDPGTKSAKGYHFNVSDHKIGRTIDRFGNHHVQDLGNRPRKAAQNYANYRSWNSMGTLGSGNDHGKLVDDDDESGYCSPPLWRTSPTSSPQHRKNHYRSLSPASKAQAIARGQRELMEMVSKMPESCYELSLKDLVEHPAVDVKQESFREEKGGKLEELVHRRDQQGVRKSDHKKVQMKRSGSLNTNNGSSEGFLLKMVFPIAFGSKKTKKKKDLAANNSSKVSPKSPAPDGSDKGVDKEWWKKRFSVSSESESTGSSNNGSGKSTTSSSSSSSGRSSGRHGGGGCWSFIRTRKSIKAA